MVNCSCIPGIAHMHARTKAEVKSLLVALFVEVSVLLKAGQEFEEAVTWYS